MRRFEIPRWVGLVIAAIAIACMVYGINRGEMATVLKKAMNICLECIGIG